jgi:hypothetical protein
METDVSDTTTFDDFEDDGPDDCQALEDYAEELLEAVEAFGVEVCEAGENR